MSDAPGNCCVAAASGQLFVVLVTPPGPQRRFVANALADRGIRVTTVGSLYELRTALDRLRPDLVVVDLAATTDPLRVLALVRTVGAPLIATSVHNPTLRAELLLTGADDCLPVSFAPEELTARIIAVVRRAYRNTSPESAALMQSGPLQIDLRARCVRVHGSEVVLTSREFALLGCLVRHSGEALSRDRLLAEVWGYTVGGTSTVTVHVRRLRSKVEADPSHPELIRTVWGIGYRFCADGQLAGTVAPTGPRRVLAS